MCRVCTSYPKEKLFHLASMKIQRNDSETYSLFCKRIRPAHAIHFLKGYLFQNKNGDCILQTTFDTSVFYDSSRHWSSSLYGIVLTFPISATPCCKSYSTTAKEDERRAKDNWNQPDTQRCSIPSRYLIV